MNSRMGSGNDSRGVIALSLAAAMVLGACVTESYAQYPGGFRPGHVESVTVMAHRRQGDPVGGAVAGALIGGLLFGGRGPAALFGAGAGAAVGASASQGSETTYSWHVFVRFDDGGSGVFVYGAPPPFQMGQPVVLTPQGLSPQGYSPPPPGYYPPQQPGPPPGTPPAPPPGYPPQ